MSEIKQIHTTARPLRIAYFVNIENCPTEQLDAIFAECYSRWSGRRTLIVPVTPEDGVHRDYKDFLYAFDPDIIYSYSDLTDDQIQNINETYCPLYLRKHTERQKRDGTIPDYNPDLPLTGLSCLSTFPLILDRKGFKDFSSSKVLDCDWGTEPPRFLTDNFGTFLTSYQNSFTATNNPNLHQAYTLIKEEHLKDQRRSKDKAREYESDFNAFLKKLYTHGAKILTLSMISEYFCWYLNCGSQNKNASFNLVIGDSTLDRILFWNFRQNYDNVSTTEIPDMIVSEKEINNEVTRNHILEIIKFRQERSQGGYPITLRSFSVKEQKLKLIAETLKKECPFAHINIQKINDHNEYIPDIDKRYSPVNFRTGMNWNEPKSTYKSNYSGSQFEVSETLPVHLKEIRIPANLRAGAWMLDISVARQLKHSRISNIEHFWLFSRRMRTDREFQRVDNAPQQDYQYRTIRTNRDKVLSIPIKYSAQNPEFRIPNDDDAILYPLFNKFGYDSFEKFGDPINNRKFYNYEISDKGRYFQGFIQYFNSISDAEKIVLNNFWYEIFSSLGATSKRTKGANIQPIVQKIDKLIENKKPRDFLKTKKEKEAFASKCLSTALKLTKEKEYISWKEINRFWEENYKNFIKENPDLKDRAEEIKKEDQRSVEKSTQFLCKSKIIFQGQRWTCPSCLHKNWESIESLSTLLTCEVCGIVQSAPISSDWHFKLNDFILEAMKEHGTTALMWCLIQLHNKAQQSFYFIPSTKFHEADENGNEINPKEADIIAIVDGELYVCEVKTSKSFGQNEFNSFVDIVNKIRPDTACLAIMEELTANKKGRLRNQLAKSIDEGIDIKILSLEEDHFTTDSMLPSGNTISFRIL